MCLAVGAAIRAPALETLDSYPSRAGLCSGAHQRFHPLALAGRLAPGIPNLNSPLASQFLYDAPKDALSYVLFGACFALVGRVLRQSTLVAGEPAGKATYDIRDGAKLTRVQLDQILVVASAGNYVEFTLADGRTLLMRSPLAAVEREFAPRGFVRTHRSRLVNAARVTALKPEGSGDYIVELGSFTAPLSRRFPEALARLRDG